MPTQTPVLLTIFNRPTQTRQVFEKIREQQPTYLYIAADGPRPHVPTDAVQCQAARNTIHVDWACTVKTRYLDKNLGCGLAMSSAITWFFTHEEYGLILEDDCVPEPSFFIFCEQMLQKYAHTPTIGMVTGSKLTPIQFKESYGFSRYPHIWGWATWRDRWQHYDYAMTQWPALRNSKTFYQLFPNWFTRTHWRLIFDAVYTGKVNTWDYQWMLTCLTKDWLAVVPNENLIQNIGFGLPDATHTSYSHQIGDRLTATLRFPLSHPAHTTAHTDYDTVLSQILVCWWKTIGKALLPQPLLRWIKKKWPRI